MQRHHAQAAPKGVEDIYRGNVGNWLLALGVIAFVLFLCSAGYILLHKQHPIRCIALGAFWVLAVPMYFFVEHLFIFKNWGIPAQYEQFTRLQDLAAKVWAGVILVLAACYFQQFPHGP